MHDRARSVRLRHEANEKGGRAEAAATLLLHRVAISSVHRLPRNAAHRPAHRRGVHVHGRAWRRRVAAGADIQRELPLSSFYLARLPRRAAVACLVGAGNAHLPLPIAPVCLNMYSCFRYD
uniref:Uncharacterized protein n=1 Tax=Leersia perrieri TaxID=77586 RepID=A0A0D9UVZ8_9ORYZ